MADDPRLTQLLEDISDLVDTKVSQKLTKNLLDFDTATISLSQFEANYMSKFDGEEKIDHGFFRQFLRWLELYYSYHLNADADIIKASIGISNITGSYIDSLTEDEYAGLTETIDGIFSHLSEHQSNIITINSSLGSQLTSINNLSASLSTHTANQNIHLIPDGTTLVADGTKMKLVDSYVRGLFSASNPIALNNGALSLNIDPATLEIDESGKLKVIGGVASSDSYGLSYNATTHILSIVANGGDSTVDLTSLLTGNTSVDLSNYLALTGKTSQSVSGDVNIDGNLVVSGEVSAYGADYAEMFEWKDGNKKAEDRVGLLVSIIKGKIEIYDTPDSGIKPDGVVSANPSVIGNNPIEWPKRYLRDSFGRIKHDQNNVPIESKMYDPILLYRKRTERQEWAAIGLLGRLRVQVDEEASEYDAYGNNYVVPSHNGMVKFTNLPTSKDMRLRVVNVINSRVVEILFK